MKSKLERVGKRLDHIISPRHFFVLENLMKEFYVNGEKPVIAQTLVNTLAESELPNKEDFWQIWKDFFGYWRSNEIVEDVENLNQRGFVHINGERPVGIYTRGDWTMVPTVLAGTTYKFVYGKDPKRVNWSKRNIEILPLVSF